MFFRSLSNVIEREWGVWKLLGLGRLTACLHKTCFHRKPGKKLSEITRLSSVICATQIEDNKGTSFHFIPEGLVKKLPFQANSISETLCRLPEWLYKAQDHG